nr:MULTISPECIES: hypothetical protein [Enterobacteriaceae]
MRRRPPVRTPVYRYRAA